MEVYAMPKVLNKRTDKISPNAVYVGRPSKWGNPYKLKKNSSREEAIAQYRNWLINEIAHSRLNIRELYGKDLVCWCAPLPCHADILLELANT